MTPLMLPNHSEKRQARVIDDSRELRRFPSADQTLMMLLEERTNSNHSLILFVFIEFCSGYH